MQTYSAPEFVQNFSEIEKSVQKGEPIYLTNEGNCSMVVLSLNFFEELTADVESKLDEADFYAKNNPKRMTHEEVFGALRRNVNV